MKKIVIGVILMLSLCNVFAEYKPYSNPANIYGSDFISFMQLLRKTGNYTTLIQFTSVKSIKKYGKLKIIAYYTNQFKNMARHKLMNVTVNPDGSRTLNYVNVEFATQVTKSVDISIENDSCKLIIPSNLYRSLI